MTILRRLAFPLWLVWTRLAKRVERVALAGLGIAAGSAMLAAVLAGGLVAQDRSLARATARLPGSDRAVRALWFGVPGRGGKSWPLLDRLAREALRPVADRDPLAVMRYRQTRIVAPSGHGGLVDLGAVDGLGRWVRLRSGRLPRPCRPSRCEVLQLGGSGRIPSVPSVPGLRLVRVGRATLSSAVPLGSLVSVPVLRTALGYHTPAAPPFLLAEGVEGLSQTPALAAIYRSYSWVLPIEPGSIHPWTIDRFAREVTRARSALGAQSYRFDLTAPVEELQAAREATRIAGRRLLLLGGAGAALLLAFALLAAASMRRDVEAAWRRLTWFGARRWQLVLLSTAESAAVAAGGALIGWAAGAGLATVLARQAGSPARAVLAHSVASWTGLAAALGVVAAATALLLGSLRARPARLGSLSVSALDVAALGAIVAIVVSVARGAADASALSAERGTGVFLMLLPGLIAFVAAVASARALVPALRAVERVGRRGPIPLRLAALSLARNPGRAAIAVTFLVVSLGLALFAEAYRSTLARGQAAQAAFAVPLDFVVREDLSQLVPVLEAAPLSRYRAAAPGVEVVPVLRLSGDVSRLAGGGVTLLGVPARALPTIEGWRNDFARVPLAELARRIEPGGPAQLRGARLPDGARELRLPVAFRGEKIAIRASILTRRGDFAHVELGKVEGAGSRVLSAQLPAEARGGRVVALTFSRTRRDDIGREEQGAVRLVVPAKGMLTLGRPAAVGPSGRQPLDADFGSWVGVDGIERIETARGTRLRYLVTSDFPAYFRPSQPTDGRRVPVVVSPRLAAAAGPGGEIPLRIADQRLVVQVVGRTQRFPSIDGDFAVADRELVATALNSRIPGSAVTNEVWLDSPPAAAAAELGSALRRPPFDVLRLSSRRQLEADLRAEPLARGSLLALAGAAAAALVLALLGLLLGLVADARDESGELFDLEAQGAEPATLRRHLRLRTLLVAAFGLAGGIVTGAVLSALVVDVVTLTAGASSAEPPLLLGVNWLLLAVALAGYAAVAAALVGAATWRTFRSPTAARLTETGA